MRTKSSFDEVCDVIVVGAGHAGCEAADAAARMGMTTALYTLDTARIAQMSCNPAIGGIAKGHLVREIDALGGLMGVIADRAGIHFRMLNTSRGPAVWSPRAQEDKARYRREMRKALEARPNLDIQQGEVTGFIFEGTRVRGIELGSGCRVGGGAVILTTGTFLNGLIHIGEEQFAAGRSGEPAAATLGAAVRRLGVEWGRLKTGTPPRLDGRTIDWAAFEVQPGDPVPTPFSHRTAKRPRNRIACYLTSTDPAIHDLIRQNMSRSPLYSGQIAALGPRYCPSIEDKVVKFADRQHHRLVLEPEGLDTHEVYLNGLSTSLPSEIQQEIVGRIPGLRDAAMIRPGYAIEYDFVQPTALQPSLEAKAYPGLFLAGQINGTTGYEEAGAQGLVAGINAVRSIRRQPALVLDRSQAYIAIMIDDLVTRGTNEPYRMFTSRAEFRLNLRIDNADLRLTPLGRDAGLIEDEHWDAFRARRKRIDALNVRLGQTRVAGEHAFFTSRRIVVRDRPTLATLLKRPEVRLEELVGAGLVSAPDLGREDLLAAETSIKYAGYLQQQDVQIRRLKEAEARALPSDLDYASMAGLSSEMVEKLTRVRPETFAQASRIPGITPAALAVVLLHLDLDRRNSAPAPASAFG